MIHHLKSSLKKSGSKSFVKISLLGWCLFDLTNSIAAVIGGIYFAKWFTIDVGASSILFNFLFFSSAFFIMLTGKWVGKRIDLDGYKFWIITSSSIAFSAILILFLGSQFLPKSYLVPFSFIVFLTFLFGYQVSRICHNVYLHSVIPEKMHSKMSGYGAAANWAGSIIGIILTIPIITIYPDMFGRELTFLIAALVYGLLTPISLFFMFISDLNSVISKLNGVQETLQWRSFISTIGPYLLIYFLLFDVMSTVQRNLPPYLTSVIEMQDNVQAIGFLIILLSAMIGGLIATKIVRYENSKSWLKICSCTLAVAIILITTMNHLALWCAFVLAGLSYGVIESAIRLNFMSTFSSRNAGENFGVLAVVERTSGVIGPLIWIVPFSFFKTEIHSYLASMLLMSGLAFMAFVLLFYVKSAINYK